MSRARQRSPRFVVGYDGSATALAAVRYAARLAGASGAIVVVNAFEPPPAEELGWPLHGQAVEEAQARGRALLEALEVDQALATVHWTGDVVAGAPAQVIDAAARNLDADAIFVGSRGAGRARALLGSVSHDLLHLANRPVMVVPRRALAEDDRLGELLGTRPTA
jgi:nucleotide-binding universal stress UspA family protein